MVVWILIIAGVVLFDQVSKILVVQFLDREVPFVIIEGVFRFRYSENRGAAFGSFVDNRWVFMIASVIGIAALCVYLFAFRPKSKLACISLSMVIGGGIGNMIDRCFRTGEIYKGENVVVDFLDFYAFPNLWNAIFNVADSFVCIGSGLLILWCILSMIEEAKAEKLAKASVSDSAATAVEAETQKEDKQENQEKSEEQENIEQAQTDK